MTTTDTRSTNRNYQLPFPSNLLAADVVRLREALIAIDVDVEALFDGLATKLNQTQVQALITSAVNGLVAGAPTALDTLNELAAALNDDENFSATVANSLATLDAKAVTAQNAANAAQATANTKASVRLALALS
jgi:hypothetical protein